MKFNYQAVENYCIQITQVLVNIRRIKEDYESQINKIKHKGIWEGPAAIAFVEKSMNVISACNGLEQSLNNVINYIRACSYNYKILESRTMNSIERF